MSCVREDAALFLVFYDRNDLSFYKNGMDNFGIKRYNINIVGLLYPETGWRE